MTSVNLLGNRSRGAHYRDPEVSPEGPRETEPLSPETAAANERLVGEWTDRLHDPPADKIMEWTHEHAPGAIAVTMSMENTVLAELAARHLPEADLLFLDTGYHFEETLATARAVDERYELPLVTARPILTRAEQDATYGPDLYRSNPTACCRMRKVEPLARQLSGYVGWGTGLRRADGPTRAHAPALSLDHTGRLKISPIITWTLEETQKFIDANHLVENPLTHQGYPSIGCATCTLPVAEGKDPRAGRWANSTKTECGLHS